MTRFANIMLIDDDEDDREIFASAIAQIGAVENFTEFSCPVEALHALKRKEVHPDLIFLDLNMPKMNGQEFLSKIKEELLLRDIPVVIFSTSGSYRNIKSTMDLGALEYITKPYRFDQLVSVLNRIFGR